MAQVTPLSETTSLPSLHRFLPATSHLLLYFHAPWAAPCQQMSTVLETLAATYPATDSPISFASADAESLPDLAETYDVDSVPFFVLLRGPEATVVETLAGADPAKLRALVEKHAAVSGTTKGANGAGIPPMQNATRPAAANGSATAASATTGGVGDGRVTKDLSGYAPSGRDTSEEVQEQEEDPAVKKEKLFVRLGQLVKAAPVMLFMKGTPSGPQCGFSRQIVALLRERGVRYGFFNILADDDVRQGLKEFADWPTFPQLWVDGELVGGLDIVREEFENNPDFLLAHMLGAHKTN